jgi:hypothetical protein
MMCHSEGECHREYSMFMNKTLPPTIRIPHCHFAADPLSKNKYSVVRRGFRPCGKFPEIFNPDSIFGSYSPFSMGNQTVPEKETREFPTYVPCFLKRYILSTCTLNLTSFT